MRQLLAALACLLAVAGCGDTTTVNEPDLVVRGEGAEPARATPDAGPSRGQGLRVASVRIAVISHGQASDPFWATVRKGVDDAADQTGLAYSYSSPDRYDVGRMRRLIDEAISSRLDGLVVSLPDVQALRAPIRRALRAGIPVVSINSGSDRFRDLGIAVHVGQPEWRAGFASGRRLVRAGVRTALCVNQERGNAGLEQRCSGLAAAMRRAGGRSERVAIDLQNPGQAQQRIAQAVKAAGADGILALGTAGAVPALKVVRAGGFGRDVELATFDLSPETLQAVRTGRILFAVDQQPYLQGYMPVVLLAERAGHLLFPAHGELIPTGPAFVTSETAEAVLELSRRGYR